MHFPRPPICAGLASICQALEHLALAFARPRQLRVSASFDSLHLAPPAPNGPLGRRRFSAQLRLLDRRRFGILLWTSWDRLQPCHCHSMMLAGVVQASPAPSLRAIRPSSREWAYIPSVVL